MLINPLVRGFATAFSSIIFLVGIASGLAAAQSRDMPISANKQALALFESARVKADNLEDAGTLFDQAVQKDPNFAYGYLFAGQTNVEFQKNLEKAVSLAAKATPAEREWIMSIEAQKSRRSGRCVDASTSPREALSARQTCAHADGQLLPRYRR